MATRKKAVAKTSHEETEHALVPDPGGVQLNVIEAINDNPVAAYAEPNLFAQLQRGAKMLASSELTPKHFQGNVANCFGAMIVAARMRLTPWEVMQSLYVVHGRMGWEAKFLIARMKSTREYAVLDWEESGKPMTDDWAMRMYGVKRELVHGEKVRVLGPWVSLGLAKAAGWVSKKDSYWLKEPDLMLRYRAATRFATLHHPDATLGFLTREELIDIGPTQEDRQEADDISASLRAAAENRVVQGEVVETPVDEPDPFDAEDFEEA